MQQNSVGDTDTDSESESDNTLQVNSRKSKYRFHNYGLRVVYDSCVLPLLKDGIHHSSHHCPASIYEESLVKKSTWTHKKWCLPHGSLLPKPFESLSKPFAKQARKSAQETELKKNRIRSCKLRLLATKEQKRALKDIFRVARYVYNWTNAKIKASKKENPKYFPTHYALNTAWARERGMSKTETDLVCQAPSFIKESNVSVTVQKNAIGQVVEAYKSCNTNQQNGNIKKYNVSFRSFKRTRTETVELGKQDILKILKNPYVTHKKHGYAYLQLGKNMKELEPILMEGSLRDIDRIGDKMRPTKELEHQCKIHWDKKLDTFHFIYVYDLPLLEDPDPKFLNKRIVAADPGINPFQAYYSPTTGEHGRLLDNETKTLEQRCKALDKLQSRIDKRWHKSSRKRSIKQYRRTTTRLKRRFARETNRLKEWVKQAHYDCANYLLGKFDIIIQPEFRSQQMVRRANRKIHTRTARAVMTWSHYRYKQRLKSTSAKYAGRHIIDSQEPGTSKTCTDCGDWNAGLRVRDKVYVCEACEIHVDRQLAGARNNFFAAYGTAVGIGWDGIGD